MVMKLDQVNKDQATQALRLVANWQPPVMRGKKISIPQPVASGFCGLMAVTGKLIAKASFVLLTKEDNRGGGGGKACLEAVREKKGMDVVKEDTQRSFLRLVWQKWMLGTGWDGHRWSVEQQRPPRRRSSFIYCPTLDGDVILNSSPQFPFQLSIQGFLKRLTFIIYRNSNV